MTRNEITNQTVVFKRTALVWNPNNNGNSMRQYRLGQGCDGYITSGGRKLPYRGTITNFRILNPILNYLIPLDWVVCTPLRAQQLNTTQHELE